MLELIKNDIQKYKLKRHILYFLFSNFISFLLILPILMVTTEKLVESAPVLIDIFAKPIFIVWEAVLSAIIVVGEYKNKTILMLFSYPYSKKELIISKVITVVGMTTVGIWGMQILLNILFFCLHLIFPSIRYNLTWSQAFLYFVSSVMVVLLGLIPLCVGVLAKSSIATLVVSIAIVSIGTTSGIGFTQLLSRVSVVCSLGIMGLICTVVTISSLIKKDVIV